MPPNFPNYKFTPKFNEGIGTWKKPYAKAYDNQSPQISNKVKILKIEKQKHHVKTEIEINFSGGTVQVWRHL